MLRKGVGLARAPDGGMRSRLPPQGRGAARDRVGGGGGVAFGKEIPVFGGAGIKVDKFREKGGDVVRGQRCLDRNMD